MQELMLGIDIGTYSSKGVACRADGTILAESRVEHEMSVPKAGFAEHDADKVWWSDFCWISRELVSKTAEEGKIVSVGVSAIGPCLLPIDKKGTPLRPGILYGVDTRASRQIEILEDQFGRDALIEFGGMRLTSQAIGPKILWLRDNEPEIFEAAHRFITATSYIIFRLTGRLVIDRHTASHFNPFISIDTLEWDLRFAEGIVRNDQLPELGWSNEIAGVITEEAAEETNLPARVPVTFGAVDALSEAISVGVVQPSDLMIMYGSTAFLISVAHDPMPTNELWLTAGAFEGQYAYAAGLATSGSATKWFRDHFAKDLVRKEEAGGANAYQSLANEASTSPSGSRGLLVLPYLSGERTPIHDPHARGALFGLTLSHSRADLYRALLEGTAFAIRHNLEAMRSAGTQVEHAVVVGGGAENRLWLEIVSNISGISQSLPVQTIGASYGDAFLAGLAVGVVEDLGKLGKEWVRYAEEIVPDRTQKDIYDSMYPLFRQLYEDTDYIAHTLANDFS